MNIKTAYGTVYGIETIDQAQQVLAKTELEREHEGCPECRGVLSLDACIDQFIRVELAEFRDRRESGMLSGDFTAREIYLVARLDAWAAVQPQVIDPLADTGAIFGVA